MSVHTHTTHSKLTNLFCTVNTCVWHAAHARVIDTCSIVAAQQFVVHSTQLHPCSECYGLQHLHRSLTQAPFSCSNGLPLLYLRSATVACFNCTAIIHDSGNHANILWQQDWKQATTILHLIYIHMASTVQCMQCIVLGLTVRECYATKSCM